MLEEPISETKRQADMMALRLDPEIYESKQATGIPQCVESALFQALLNGKARKRQDEKSLSEICKKQAVRKIHFPIRRKDGPS